jgi:hypothetical protein
MKIENYVVYEYLMRIIIYFLVVYDDVGYALLLN